MSIFASKATFMDLGLEEITPSTAHMYQDCYICQHPLHINVHTTPSDKHHEAVRIGACGHMHGRECLAAWLDAGNSCPSCRRLLFEAQGRGVSQSDVNSVFRALGHRFGAKRVVFAIQRVVQMQERGRVLMRQTVREERREVVAAEVRGRRDDVDDDDYWVDSGDEGFDDENGDFEMGDGLSDMESDEDGGIALDGEVGLRSAKA